MTVAALYVDPKGAYANLPDVEVWDEARDARTYAGPWPVVAHPPCARWCRFAKGVEWGHYGYKGAQNRNRPRLSGSILASTPPEFRDVLLGMARSAQPSLAILSPLDIAP